MASLLHDLHIEPGALVVNIVSFVVLLWLMKRFLFAPVGAFIEQRKARIAEDLDQAESDRAKAAAELEGIEGRRAELLDKAREAAEGTQQDALREANETKNIARNDARRIERAGRDAVLREQREVAAALRDETGEAAADMCRRLLQQTLTDDRHRALVDQFIVDIEELAAQQEQGPR